MVRLAAASEGNRVFVQTLVAQATIERFHKAILLRLARGGSFRSTYIAKVRRDGQGACVLTAIRSDRVVPRAAMLALFGCMLLLRLIRR